MTHLLDTGFSLPGIRRGMSQIPFPSCFWIWKELNTALSTTKEAEMSFSSRRLVIEETAFSQPDLRTGTGVLSGESAPGKIADRTFNCKVPCNGGLAGISGDHDNGVTNLF